MTATPEVVRLWMRPKTYRGIVGWHIYGSGRSIFTRTKRSARRIKAKILRGQDIDLSDFRC